MTDEIDDEYQQDNAHDNHNSSSHSSNDQTTVAVIPGQNNRGKKVVAARFRPKQRVTKSVAVNDANTGEARSVVSAKKSNTAFARNENTSTSVRNGATVKGRDDSICQKPGPGNDSKRASAMMDGVDETVTDKNDMIEDKESNKSDADSKVVKASTLSSSARTSSTRSVVQAGSSFGKRRSTGSAVVVGESSFSTSSPSKVVASTLPQSPEVAASVQVASIADGSASHSIKANSSSNGAIIIPRPLAGELSLKDFCSKYRDPSAPKKKRGRKRKGEADDENNEKETTKESEFDDVEENMNKPRKQKAKMTKIVSNKSSVRNMDSSEPVVDSSGPVVELVDGEIVIRESSLVVGGGDTNVDEEYEEVHEGAGEMTATYTSFTNRTKRKTWSAEETKLFYEALRQVGPDFSMMNAFFVDRDRKQLKNKYKVETRKNPQLIQMALERERQKPIGKVLLLSKNNLFKIAYVFVV